LLPTPAARRWRWSDAVGPHRGLRRPERGGRYQRPDTNADAVPRSNLSRCPPARQLIAEMPLASRGAPARVRFVPRSTGAASAPGGTGIRVVGGLMPSANLAAQAGAIDPTIPAWRWRPATCRGADASPVRRRLWTWRRAPIRVDCAPR
jgi:hypothetical protein